jgi:Secretion system C-terminal sorting domain/Vault protein inter-alpha-trypsin domain
MLTFSTKIAFILSLFALPFSFIYGQNSLNVQDPQKTFRYGQARIESASFDVIPRGLYAEVSLNMTYSAQGTSYTAVADTLEIQHYFTLPANALITDSWLWVEKQIVYAKLIDRWTASAIYEGIVNRRKDPSILFKNYATSYEYRIFPMSGNSSRRVQLQFMMPIDWQSGVASFELPTNIIRSGNRLPTTNVRIFNNNQWKNPRLVDYSSQTFTASNDSTTNQPIQMTTLTTEQVRNFSNIRLSFDSPMKNGVFLSTYKSGNDNYYQMAVQPDEILSVNITPRKLMYVLDFNNSSTNLKAADFIANLKQNLRTSLTSKDSFNLIFSKLSPNLISSKWISVNDLEATLAQISESSVAAINNLPTVLTKGIEFLNNDKTASIVLVSNDVSLNNLNASNSLSSELKKNFPVLPVINVFDISPQTNYFFVGGIYYYGNDYFYNIITSQTGGISLNTPYYTNTDIKAPFSQFFKSLAPNFDNLDIHTTLKDGFTFSRFDIGSTSTFNVNKTFLQVGKYNGNLPFEIEVTGSYQSTPFGKRLTISDSLIAAADSKTRQIWVGAQILNWESQSSDNVTVKRIIQTSQENLVLSRYTAFLALEPNMGGDTCLACRDKSATQVTATKELSSDYFRLKASPNPFKESTTIKVEFPSFKVGQKADMVIYNLLGQTIHRFNLDIKSGDKSAEVVWETNNVQAGVYMVRFSTGSVVKTLKIVKMK